MQLILEPQGGSVHIQDTMSTNNLQTVLDNPVKNCIAEKNDAETKNGITCDKENNFSINNLDIKEDIQDKEDKAMGDLVTENFKREKDIGNDEKESSNNLSETDPHVEQRQSKESTTSSTTEENVHLEEDVFVTAKNSEIETKHEDVHNLESTEDSLRKDLIQPVFAKLKAIANDENEETKANINVADINEENETLEVKDKANIIVEENVNVEDTSKNVVEMKIENTENVKTEDKVTMDIELGNKDNSEVKHEERTDEETKVSTELENITSFKGEVNMEVDDKTDTTVEVKENIEVKNVLTKADGIVNMEVELAKGEGQEFDNTDVLIKDTSEEVKDDKVVEPTSNLDTLSNDVEMPDTVVTSNVEPDRTEAPDRAGGDGSMIATEEPAIELALSKTDTTNDCHNITDIEKSSDVDMETLGKEDEDLNCIVKDDSVDSLPNEVTEIFKKDSSVIDMDTDGSVSSQLKLTDSVGDSTEEGAVALTSSESEKLSANSNDDHVAGLPDVNNKEVILNKTNETHLNIIDDDKDEISKENNETINEGKESISEEKNEVVKCSEIDKSHKSIDERIVETTNEKTNNIQNETVVEKVNDLENPTANETVMSRESGKPHLINDDDQVIEVPDEKTEEPQNDEIVDEDEIKIVEDVIPERMTSPAKINDEKTPAPVIKLSNTMDILSDDEDESHKTDKNVDVTESIEKQCINLDDDDDIMLIDDDVNKDDKKENASMDVVAEKEEEHSKLETETEVLDLEKTKDEKIGSPGTITKEDKEPKTPDNEVKEANESSTQEKNVVVPEVKSKYKPLVPEEFFKTYRKNLGEMNRNDLEEFCILKIVESIIDRTNLNEIRTKIKNLASTIEEYKKKTITLAKQNRDLQVVLKSVKEEQKKRTDQPIVPLRITRSVGMQVLMTDKNRRRMTGPLPTAQSTNNVNSNVNQVPNTNTRPIRNVNQASRTQNQIKTINSPQNIPVPRLVPAPTSANNKVTPQVSMVKSSPMQNGTKATPPVQKSAEKRPRLQSQSSSVTVDLTDDEPPAKVMTKTPPPVRIVNQQNLMAPKQQFNSPRKVYIPISGPQAIRPGRPRGPAPPMVRMAQNTMPVKQTAAVVRRVQGTRHPAPLPDNMKQYQPPNWKALPPAPDLKLSKVENGIVISWKIDGYQEDSYEEIASYQLYAYQETSATPSTALWKKIGDVKALPLPMACTLTQFMAGYKYYFAVRAVDVKSRLGPFSAPGSILLLNKMSGLRDRRRARYAVGPQKRKREAKISAALKQTGKI